MNLENKKWFQLYKWQNITMLVIVFIHIIIYVVLKWSEDSFVDKISMLLPVLLNILLLWVLFILGNLIYKKSKHKLLKTLAMAIAIAIPTILLSGLGYIIGYTQGVESINIIIDNQDVEDRPIDNINSLYE